VAIVDWGPVSRSEPLINPRNYCFYRQSGFSVSSHVLAGGHADLDEPGASAESRLELEQPLEGEQPLRNAFGVVESIYPDEQWAIRPSPDPGGLLEDIGLPRRCRKPCGVNAHRTGDQLRLPGLNRRLGTPESVAEKEPDRGGEMAGVVSGVKPDRVCAKHALEQFGSVGERCKQSRRRKWSVQEKPDPGARAPRPEKRRQEQQVIIMDPDPIPRPDVLGDDIGIPLIDGTVELPIVVASDRLPNPAVECWPERFVRETAIVAGDLLVRERN
jgi:hypothetical protein